jgi:hypothetical protein
MPLIERDSGSKASAAPQMTKQGGSVPGLIARNGLTRGSLRAAGY